MDTPTTEDMMSDCEYIRPVYRRDIIRGVRDAWNRQYADWDGSYRFPDGCTVAEIRRGLEALDLETCSVEDVKAAMGTGGWVSNQCDACGQDFPVLLEIGDEPDYEARWLDLCEGCLETALLKIRSLKHKEPADER